VLLPEVETDPERVALELRSAYERGKSHAIAVVAEGARHNAAERPEHSTAYLEREWARQLPSIWSEMKLAC
jgi:6-phosphofructokinase 1